MALVGHSGLHTLQDLEQAKTAFGNLRPYAVGLFSTGRSNGQRAFQILAFYVQAHEKGPVKPEAFSGRHPHQHSLQDPIKVLGT